MKPDQIIRSLRKIGLDQVTIAEGFGCSASLISKVINRKATSTHVAKKLAKLLNEPFLTVFPEYEHNELRNSLSREDKLLLIKSLINSE